LSQVLTLYTTPVIYIFFDRLAERVKGRRLSQMPVIAEGRPGAESA